MQQKEDVVPAVATVAERWLDEEYSIRQKAVDATLGAPNRFTEEAIHFAVNQQMHQLTNEALMAWVDGRLSDGDPIVGVLNPGNVPFADLQDFLGVVLAGATYRGSVSRRSPFLLPAFAMDLSKELGGSSAEFVARENLFPGVNKFIATGGESALAWAQEAAAGMSLDPEDVLVRGHGIGIAVLSGREDEDDLEHLAEDALLHEGLGCRSIAVVWVPEGMSPDPFLDACAHFRGVFPAHEETAGVLELQRAFLAAVQLPHAYGDDKSFLVSKGDAELQRPGHIRWTEYADMNDVSEWIAKHDGLIQVIVSKEPGKIDDPRSVPLGFAQRPHLGWAQSGIDLIDFICR